MKLNIPRAFKKTFKLINNPSIIVYKLLNITLRELLPDELFIKIQFKALFGRKLNLKMPITYAEKLQWLKLNEVNYEYTKLVDKYEVRSYVRNLIGEKYLIPLLYFYKNAKDIKWDKLPNKFVLKCTHDSGSVIICNDKSLIDKNEIVRKLNNKLKSNLYYYSREYPYKNVNARIICEKLIGDGKTAPIDYKFMCFNGKVEFIILDFDRFTKHRRDIYDLQWNKLSIITDHPMSDLLIEKPLNFDEMINICNKLSKGFKHIRVDLYDVNNKIYFGELTLFPWAGLIRFYPEEWNKRFGDLIKI